ncbi:MAG: hypothetical protein AAFY41_11620 [Bacteroidota bacterium]
MSVAINTTRTTIHELYVDCSDLTEPDIRKIYQGLESLNPLYIEVDTCEMSTTPCGIVWQTNDQNLCTNVELSLANGDYLM